MDIRHRETVATSKLAIYTGLIKDTSAFLGRLSSLCAVLYLTPTGRVHNATVTVALLLLLDRSDWIDKNVSTAVMK